MASYPHPGVFLEDATSLPAVPLETGVPIFLGYAESGSFEPQCLHSAPAFRDLFGPPPESGYLAAAVNGFFANDGRRCYVARLKPDAVPLTALRTALAALASLDDIDLVAAPDVMLRSAAEVPAHQNEILSHCDVAGDRFALLDAQRDPEAAVAQNAALSGTNGALYAPWVQPLDRDDFVPPSGHVAGVVSRTDRQVGIHKAPANEELEGVVDLDGEVAGPALAARQRLIESGINLIRALPGRGFRTWGARTVATDPAWRHVNVRRLLLQLGRQLERRLADVAFEPNHQPLWTRIGREIEQILEPLFQAGALHGATAEAAYSVRCDAETNPPELRDASRVSAEIALAPAAPGEWVVIRLIHDPSGLRLATPAA